MRFTIDRKDLINLVKRVEGRQQRAKAGKPVLRLSAVGSWVFVEGVNIACGTEALVLADGSCRAPRTLFLKLLKRYEPKRNLTIDADDHVIRIGSFSMPHENYTKQVKPPAEFAGIPVTDTWVAQGTVDTPKVRSAEKTSGNDGSGRRRGRLGSG